ncbi:hypothetical protein Awo_c29560 [Acetobacterium woodii DSM 1030]|uniref:Uncharacterized protein n=1 Tax=Acetobacterium woodii (strain ATCC 29683 / DSM 1030 / JCM 2381 / KCTC 1655 / WB1) TaxID=931626 RepID=H6LHI0_ACEWD|nr:hypothetical protein Awo_c29560 [Acetobacterium woodii DSM 1030]
MASVGFASVVHGRYYSDLDLADRSQSEGEILLGCRICVFVLHQPGVCEGCGAILLLAYKKDALAKLCAA